MTNRRWAIALALLAVLAAILVAPYDPLKVDLAHRLEPPSLQFPLGTDQLGRSQLSRTISGARNSLGLAVLTALIVSGLAIAVGSLAAFGGPFVDRQVRRLINVFISFPSLVLALAVIGTIGPSSGAAVIAISWAWWPPEARLARSLLLAARQREYVDAAWLSGVDPVRLLFRHMLPHAGPALAVRFSLEVGSIVLALSTLSFLGLGTQPPAAEWGVMLNEARPFLTTAPHLLLGPGLALFLVVLCCNLAAEGLRGRVDRRCA